MMPDLSDRLPSAENPNAVTLLQLPTTYSIDRLGTHLKVGRSTGPGGSSSIGHLYQSRVF